MVLHNVLGFRQKTNGCTDLFTVQLFRMAVMVFGFPFASDSRIWSEEVTCQLDCNRTLSMTGGFADSVVFSVVLICLAALKCVAISSRQLSLHRQPPIAPHSTKERSKKERYRYGAGKGDIVSEGEHF